MSKFILFLLLLILIPFLANALDVVEPKVAGFIPNRLDWIDSMVQECVNQQELPGAVAILVKNGRIGYFKSFGFADIDSQKPMGKTAMFRIASMSKLITTVAALQLYERGHYHMETPLGSILPEFDQPEVFISWDEDKQTFQTEPARKKIRMKHLFTHTSGIVYPIFTDKGRSGYMKAKITDAFPDGSIDLAENIRRLASVPLAHQPGDGYTYGMNMDVLGRVIEVIDGRPFDRYMREEIFRPLGMIDTGFSIPDDKQDRIVSVYTTRNGEMKPFDEQVMAEQASNNFKEWWKLDADKIALGGAGIISTTYDYALFLQMLVNKGQLNGQRILGRKTVELISRGVYSQGAESTTAIGLSVSVVVNEKGHYRPDSVGTFVGGGYFYTSFWVDPKEQMIGVLMSQINPSNSQVGGNFKIMAYAALE